MCSGGCAARGNLPDIAPATEIEVVKNVCTALDFLSCSEFDSPASKVNRNCASWRGVEEAARDDLRVIVPAAPAAWIECNAYWGMCWRSTVRHDLSFLDQGVKDISARWFACEAKLLHIESCTWHS